MWQLYLTAKTTSQRPSDLIAVEDRWAALQFDNAVVMIGTAIENALTEKVDVGDDDESEWVPKYTMTELLDSEFRLPIDDKIDEISDLGEEFYDEVRE